MSTHPYREPDPPPEGRSAPVPPPEQQADAETSLGPKEHPPAPEPPARNGAEGAAGHGHTAHAGALAEIQDRWRRALEDLDRLRRSHAEELDRERAAERDRTAAALLPVVDGLELLLAHAELGPGPLLAEVEEVHDRAVGILAALGYARHAEEGVPFDPARHEMAGAIEDPNTEPGTVLRVLRPGYGDGDHRLRPATVTVARRA
ncbi:nucleotide exchange factor GrpE [Streptomyces sp. URMC 123]|uniref:nucleotide exchange factor GrpE n=1 Tax=Streptomyces sp. URMC 123 TaxID=3423403 RepID=UPI003F1D12F3